jgi:hypothetical protein
VLLPPPAGPGLDVLLQPMQIRTFLVTVAGPAGGV